MIKDHPNIFMIETIARGLGDYCYETVFVGGAVTIFYKVNIILPSGVKIFIFSLDFYLASKIEAFTKRGEGDFLGSKDIEDIVTVLDGTIDLKSVMINNNDATAFLAQTFRSYSENEEFIQSLAGHMEPGLEMRAKRILDFFHSL